MRSRPTNIARGTPRDGGLAVIRTSASLDVARRRGPRVFRTRRRPARPSSFGAAAELELRLALGRPKNRSDAARLVETSSRLIYSVRARGRGHPAFAKALGLPASAGTNGDWFRMSRQRKGQAPAMTSQSHWHGYSVFI